MFRKILIANRGEIACRVIKTAHRLGIAAIAIYSEADRHSLHVDTADEAWPVGPPPARESYLNIERIIEAARCSGAEAVHPGYGFLAENADFAEACEDAGLEFIGPPPSAIRAMGSKAAAKNIMARAGVPLVPGYHGAAQDLASLRDAAQQVGYPVLIKASAGGGGKGMRVVERASAFGAALEGAQREARASFGDDRVLIERYLTRPRHIEIQVFADRHGNAVSLFERDCSIQRRYQKVLEEAPAPGMDPDRRRAMGEAATAAARAVDYVGAGTVEFIAEGDAFYFMEMNTRLQVEHPVTEMITGLDLVEWQLRVAAGEKLPLSQDQLAIRGHAIEARVYAEDPARDFLPSIGTLTHLRQPRENTDVRVDTGVRQGDAISTHYDPMIAKLIVWGHHRDAAVRRLAAALEEYEVAGVQTNLTLLRAIVTHPAFGRGELDTGFIARHSDNLLSVPAEDETMVLAAAALAVLADKEVRLASNDSWSPWDVADAWRMNGDGYQDLELRRGKEAIKLRAHVQADGGYMLDLPAGPVRAALDGGRLSLDGVVRTVHTVRRQTEVSVLHGGRSEIVQVVDTLAAPGSTAARDDRVTAPIPAKVTRVLVKSGDVVKRGAPLVVLEAMKMELTLSAPQDGTIGAVRHEVGEMVEEGAELVSFAGQRAEDDNAMR